MSDGMRFEEREVIREFVRDLSGASERVRQGAVVAVTKSSQDVARDARALAPVDTGLLRSSIAYEVRPLAGGGVEGDTFSTAAYGRHVEEGTSRHGPQPFIRPAFDRNIPVFEQALQQLLSEVLD